jgi:hypothetical protein
MEGIMDGDSWRTLCAFARKPYSAGDPSEPWEVVTTPKLKPKTRKRRMTLALSEDDKVILTDSRRRRPRRRPDGATPDQAYFTTLPLRLAA